MIILKNFSVYIIVSLVQMQISYACELPGIINIVSAQPTFELRTINDNRLLPSIISEINPTIVELEAPEVFLSTKYTWLCQGSKSDDPALLFSTSQQKCKVFTLPGTMQANASPKEWDLSYNGVASAALIKNDDLSEIILLARQGENKNEKIGTKFFQNTLNTGVKAQSCFSGLHSGAYEDCWASYNSFINGSIAYKTNKSSVFPPFFEDIGPIIWPSMGYSSHGEKLSNGVRSPSLIYTQNYIYLYYNDTSSGKELGRKGGLHVARASIHEPNSKPVFIPFFDGKFDPNNPSLPAGFSTQNIEKFNGLAGGKADQLWSDSARTNKFRVSHIIGSEYYLGVTEGGGFNKMPWELKLRLSCDLVHWSSPALIPGEHEDNWLAGDLHYPVFYGISGARQSEIDPGQFSLVGVTAKGHIVMKRMSIKIPN